MPSGVVNLYRAAKGLEVLAIADPVLLGLQKMLEKVSVSQI